MHRLAAILLTIWAGSLWTICALVAPTLFAALPDRRLAGDLAARIFHIEAWLGLGIGAALLLIGLKGGAWSGRTTRWLVAVTAVAPLMSEMVLAPMMERARVAGDMARFGMLHGVAAALFVVACAGALALVWRFNRPAG